MEISVLFYCIYDIQFCYSMHASTFMHVYFGLQEIRFDHMKLAIASASLLPHSQLQYVPIAV